MGDDDKSDIFEMRDKNFFHYSFGSREVKKKMKINLVLFFFTGFKPMNIRVPKT